MKFSRSVSSFFQAVKQNKVHADSTMACPNDQVQELIRKTFDELARLYAELKPFDSIHDEDMLDCKYEQRHMIHNDIDNLRNTNDVDKLAAFQKLLVEIDSDIDMLTMMRMVEYSKWKTQYMSVCMKINELEKKIHRLLQSERTMNIA
jgi:hypothetical protein